MPRRTLLDPKLDIVFWMLFGAERNRELLLSLLNAVLQPAAPIVSIEVLPAEPERLSVFDIRCQLANGEQIDVEMQSLKRPAQRHRWLFYWARLYAGQLQRGQPYTELKRTVVVVIANFSEFEASPFHSRFALQERRTGEVLSDHFELHFVELPKLREALSTREEPELVRWARFLSAESDDELEQLAMESPILKQAKQALSALSEDDKARIRAEQREMALISNELDLTAAREQGELEGRRKTLRQLLTARFGQVSRDAERRLADAGAAELERWTARLLVAETLEDVFA